MINYLEDFIYFNNNINYLKNITKKENCKNFNEIFLIKKKNSYLQLFILISIIILLGVIIFHFKLSKLLMFLFMNILALFLIFTKIIVINFFVNTYTYFIKLCENIVKFETKMKEKLKIKSLLKTQENEAELILIQIIKNISYSIGVENCNFNINNKEENKLLFNEYQKLKQKLFEYIFLIYEKEFISKDLYIIKCIKFLFNYSKSINYKLNYIINIFNNALSELNKEKINFGSLFKSYEKYINNNIINSKEKKKNELNSSILNLFEINYRLNEQYINLIKEINLENYNDEKICEIINFILEKQRLSIALFEQIKNKLDNEDEKINENNNNINIEKNKSNISNMINDDKISLTDIQLNNINYNKRNKNSNEEEKLNKNRKNSRNKSYDINSEQKKMELLKSDFIDELNKYYQSKKIINKKESEITDKNEDEINNKKKYIIEKSKENNFNEIKMDFAKSLTMSLKKNKNFNFNFSRENEENKKDN